MTKYPRKKLTSKTGATTWAAQYQAFGNANITIQSTTNNLRFPGQYNDGETNLHYNWNRYYNNGTGRYVTSDPIGLKGGLNTYGYVGGNPLTWGDPLGLAAGINKRNKDNFRTAADLLDSVVCDWWPASCLSKCVRWRCSIVDGCETRVWFVGEDAPPGISSPDYNPDNDENCVCVRSTINPD